MTTGTDGTPLAFHALAKELKALGRERFAEHYGHAFLLLHAADLAGRAPGETVLPVERVNTASTTFHVFPLQKSDRNAEPYLTIGRTSDNDLVVADDAMSRRHAGLTEVQGTWTVYDLGSRNGTFLSDEAVPGVAEGGRTLAPHANVRFGSVMMKFMTLDGFVRFASAFIGPL